MGFSVHITTYIAVDQGLLLHHLSQKYPCASDTEFDFAQDWRFVVIGNSPETMVLDERRSSSVEDFACVLRTMITDEFLVGDGLDFFEGGSVQWFNNQDDNAWIMVNEDSSYKGQEHLDLAYEQTVDLLQKWRTLDPEASIVTTCSLD